MAANYPRFNALKGRRGIWHRQRSDSLERTDQAIGATIKNILRGDLYCPKVADGVYLQGFVDDSGYTPYRSLEAIASVRDAFRDQGIAFCPVVVPRDPTVADIYEQAELHAAIARLCGCLMIDLEPYDYFWRYQQELIPYYTERLRAASGDAYLVNQPDPREFAVGPSRVYETAGHFDAMCAQHYVGWTSGNPPVNWTNVDLEVQRFNQLAATGLDMFVTLYGVDTISLARELWRRVAARADGWHVFTLGSMNQDQLEYFGNTCQLRAGLVPDPIPGTWQEPPVPPPPPPDPSVPTVGAVAREYLKAATYDSIGAEMRMSWAEGVLAQVGDTYTRAEALQEVTR